MKDVEGCTEKLEADVMSCWKWHNSSSESLMTCIKQQLQRQLRMSYLEELKAASFKSNESSERRIAGRRIHTTKVEDSSSTD